MSIPSSVTTVPALIEWLNSGNVSPDLVPNFGTVYAAGTSNDSESLNKAQQDGLFVVNATIQNDGTYIIDNSDLNEFWIHEEAGPFEATLFAKFDAVDLLKVPKIVIGGVSYTLDRYPSTDKYTFVKIYPVDRVAKLLLTGTSSTSGSADDFTVCMLSRIFS